MNGYVSVQFKKDGRIYTYMVPDYIALYDIENWVVVENQLCKNQCPYQIARVIHKFTSEDKYKVLDFTPTKYIAGAIPGTEYVEAQKEFDVLRQKEEQLNNDIIHVIHELSTNDKKDALNLLKLIKQSSNY